MLKTILAVLGALVAIPAMLVVTGIAYLLIADTIERNKKNNSQNGNIQN